MMKKNLLYILLIIPFSIFAQNREHAFEVNSRLGRGINFGNIFEGDPSWGLGWEDHWSDDFPVMISQLGFDHVRIPIRWEPSARSLSNYPYTINADFLNKMKGVVDVCLNNNLMVIIDMHHHEELLADPVLQKDRFLSQWKQISQAFSEYSDDLLFEIINEPNNGLVGNTLNVFLKDALNVIREDNPTRVVLITSEWDTPGTISKLVVPDDDNIILTQHCYVPTQFTHQGSGWVSNSDEWIGTTWNDTEPERYEIINQIKPIIKFSNDNNIPIHIGEFGAYSAADDVSREKWTTFMGRYIESLGWSWAYWEFSGGFGIYDRGTTQYRQFLVDALVNNQMPEPAALNKSTIYTSDFSSSTDNWTTVDRVGTGAQSSVANEEGQLVCHIEYTGISASDIKLMRDGIVLEAGKQYQVTFKAKAAEQRWVTAYVGAGSSPWMPYGDYQPLIIDDTMSEYSFSFTMEDNISDNDARIKFDIGTNSADLYFEYVKLEEVSLKTTGFKDLKYINTSVYPNPVIDKLFINNLDDFQTLKVININGRVIKSLKITNALNEIDLKDLQSGLYLVALYKSSGRHICKIVKK